METNGGIFYLIAGNDIIMTAIKVKNDTSVYVDNYVEVVDFLKKTLKK
ncbi:MAG: hypothetical protein NC081_03265 [Roseburia sp.]|nr:hypothetical protein [Roseburia sp.]